MIIATLLSCSLLPARQVPPEEIEALLKTWATENADGFVIDVNSGSLKSACQQDVCEGFAVRGVERISYMRFGDGAKQDPTIEGLRAHFDYVSYRLPVMEAGDWKISLDWPDRVARASEGRVVFESYDGGQLKMQIHHDATSLDAVNTSARCTPPPDDELPPGCVLSQAVKIRATLNVDVPMPSPAEG